MKWRFHLEVSRGHGYVIDILNEAYEIGKVSGNITDESFEGVTYVSIDNVLKKVNSYVCHTKRAKQNVDCILDQRLRISVISDLDAMDAFIKEAFTLKITFQYQLFRKLTLSLTLSDIVKSSKS